MASNLPPDDYAYLRRAIPERVLRDLRSSEDYFEYLNGRVSRRDVLKALGVAGAVVVAGPVLWSQPGYSAEPPRGIHLAYGTNPAKEMSISWFTSGNVSKPVVDVGIDARFGRTIPAQTITYRVPAAFGQPAPSVQHHVTVTGLQPGRTYRYRVRHAGASSGIGSFKTAPGKIVPFTFTAFGDHGISPGTNTQYLTSGTVFSPRAVDAVKALGGAFHIVAGDVSYASGVQSIWDVWSEEVQPSAAAVPWMVGVGNHEMELGIDPDGYAPFRTRFRMPRNGINWRPERTSTFYAFQYSNVVLIVLDGNDAASEPGYKHNNKLYRGKQDAWLARTLKAARSSPTVDWIVVSFHNCMYCTDSIHGSDGGCRARWQKLFEKYTVDVVLNGHNHCYERTHPIKGSEHTMLTALDGPVDPVKMGVMYLCVGGGGQEAARSAPTYPLGTLFDTESTRTLEVADWRASRFSGYSVAKFSVDPGVKGGKTRLMLSTREFMTPALAEVDAITLERPAKAIAARPKPPAPLPATGE